MQAEYLSDPAAVALLDAAGAVAERKGATVAQVALAWVIAVPGVTSAIASATSPEQLSELFGAVASSSTRRISPSSTRAAGAAS